MKSRLDEAEERISEQNYKIEKNSQTGKKDEKELKKKKRV